MDVPLNATWLETFTTLSDVMSFTRTAERLNMTQPGVSQHIRKLEDQLGQPLLLRDGKRLALTEAGEHLRQVGLRRRQEELHLRQRLGRDDPGQGQVRIGCSGGFALLLWPALRAHLQCNPGLQMSLVAMPARTMERALSDGELDLAIMHAPSSMARLESRQIGQDQIRLLLPPGSAAQVEPDTLRELPFVGHPDGQSLLARVWRRNFSGTLPEAEPRVFINQIGQILLPVEAGLGYTALPESALRALSGASQQSVTVASLPNPLSDPLWLIAPRQAAEPARLHPIRDIISEVAASLAEAPAPAR